LFTTKTILLFLKLNHNLITVRGHNHPAKNGLTSCVEVSRAGLVKNFLMCQCLTGLRAEGAVLAFQQNEQVFEMFFEILPQSLVD